MDGCMEGRKDGLTEGRIDGRTGGRMDAWTEGRTGMRLPYRASKTSTKTGDEHRNIVFSASQRTALKFAHPCSRDFRCITLN
jgi:hypothetical protein